MKVSTIPEQRMTKLEELKAALAAAAAVDAADEKFRDAYDDYWAERKKQGDAQDG